MKYAPEKIQELLDRYWEGESTLEEERFLRRYFKEGKFDPRFAQEAPFFQVLAEESAIGYPTRKISISYRPMLQWAAAAAVLLIAGIVSWWSWPQNNRPAPEVAQNTEVSAPQKQAVQQATLPSIPLAQAVVPKRKLRLHSALKAPAIATAVPADTMSAEQALQEIRSAFALLSSKINKGKREAVKGVQEVEHLRVFKKNTTDG